MYPIDVVAERGDGQRSRGLGALGIVGLKGLIALPHLLVLWVLGMVAGVVAWLGYWVVAFTGTLPPFFHEFPARTLAWQVRTTGWIYSFTDSYPPFEWSPVGYPVDLQVSEPPGPRSRGLAVLGIILLKLVALVPHFIVLVFVGFAAAIALWIAYWVILFTGNYPPGMFGFVQGALRWSTRLGAWAFTLTDRYPPFRLEP